MERDILFRLRKNCEDLAAPVVRHPARTRLSSRWRCICARVRDPIASFASVDELRLLACIAIAQRQSIRRDDSWSAAMRKIFVDCGAKLAAEGQKLPHDSIRRMPDLRAFTENAQNAAPEVPTDSPAPLSAEVARAGVHQISARARALALAESMIELRINDFAKIGVSRQTLSQLCKGGLLQRDMRGRYRMAQAG